jgi:hypothetical protein
MADSAMAESYFERHAQAVEVRLEELVNELLDERPDDPMQFLSDRLLETASKNAVARQPDGPGGASADARTERARAERAEEERRAAEQNASMEKK